MGRIWRSYCSEVDNPQTILWVVSIYGSAQNVSPESSRVVGQSDAWQVRGEGGDCVTRLPAQPAPINADTFTITLSNGEILPTYRARPIQLTSDFKPLNVNIGWTLVDLQTTPAARPGEVVSVTHIWRVEALPQEPHAHWYYAPFVNLVGPDGQRVLMIDKAPSILGVAWQPGRYIVSTIRFQLPAELSAGAYKLELTLFDPNEKRNAVYFDPARPDEMILTLERSLELR
jgi:hypothetical protein